MIKGCLKSFLSLVLAGLFLVLISSSSLIYRHIQGQLPQGVLVNSHQAAGKTLPQLWQKLTEEMEETLEIKLLLPTGEVFQSLRLDVAELGATYPTKVLLNALEDFLTVEDYLRRELSLRPEPYALTVPINLDPHKVWQWVNEIAVTHSTLPRNASISVWRGVTTLVPDTLGFWVHPTDLYLAVVSCLTQGCGGPLSVTGNTIAPQVTTCDLPDFTKQLNHFSTPLGEDLNRRTNVSLAASFIDQQIIEPGQTLSFLGLVGQASKERGFMPAPVIISQQRIDSYGGGICQVSTTLYQSALRSDLEIVSRKNHSLPVEYVPMGMDAAVSYPSLDLIIANPYSFPIMINAWLDDDSFHVSLHASPKHQARTKEIVVTETQVFRPPTEIIYDNSLPAGTEIIDRPGELGYRVWVYREIYSPGQEDALEFVSVDSYSSLARVIRRGTRAF